MGQYGTLLPRTKEECILLYEHWGCFKCQHLYAGHIQHDCLNNFPQVHTMITPAMAASAKVDFEKMQHAGWSNCQCMHAAIHSLALHEGPSSDSKHATQC